MIDFSVVEIENVRTERNIKKGDVSFVSSNGITDGINRIMQDIYIKLINKGDGVLSVASEELFIELATHIVYEIRDEIMGEQEELMKTKTLDQSEILTDLYVKRNGNTGKSIILELVVADQQKAYNVAFSTMR